MRDWKRAYCPPEWRPRKLVDVIELPSGQVDPRRLPFCAMPLIAPDHVESGSGTVLAIQTAAEQGAISGKYLFDEDDVVYSKIRPYLRKAFLAGMAGLCSADMYPLRARLDELDPRFLLGVVLGEHFSRFAEIVSMRSGFPKINREELAEYIAALPPLPEQRAIAAVLDTIDDAIQKTELIIAKLQQVKQGLLHDLLTRGIDDNGELRDPERHPEQFQDSPLGRIPRGWRSTTLGEIATWTSGGTPSKTIPAYWTGDIPWVSPKDMKAFELADTQDHGSSAGVAAGSRLVPKETVLIVVRGMILAHTFPVCIAMQAMALNQDVKGLIPSTTVRGRYLGHWLVSHSPQLLTLVTEATHGTKRIELRDIQTIAFGSPPRSEQDEVLRRVDALGVQLHAEAAALQKLRLMKSGISDDLLSGRVRTTSLPEFTA